MSVEPYKLKDAPALIERLLPVQKLSAEVHKERMAGSGQTLTALGSYWKGRKPLILAKACILGALLPATDNPRKDLEIFELLMGMDMESMTKRLEAKGGKAAQKLIQQLSNREAVPYRELVRAAKRPEEVGDQLFDHVWEKVNEHLGTDAHSFPELIEQLGIMRFGHRPKVADTFCGSGQIPFEAARLGCDVFASDLNPIAAMLTWGAFHIVGAQPEERKLLEEKREELIKRVQEEIDSLGIEEDGRGWRAKVFLYCVEVRCPQSGWMVPLLPTLIVSKGYKVIARLVPDHANKRYDIEIVSGVSKEELELAKEGTVRSDGRGGDPYLFHIVGGKEYRTKISTLRGDYRNPDGTTGNKLRLWEKHDFKPRPDDIFQERLYCIQWMRPKKNSKQWEYEFRAVTDEDLKREKIVEDFIAKHLEEWQEKGWIPDLKIEPGFNTKQPIWERGWTHWHHLFNPRQLLQFAFLKRFSSELSHSAALQVFIVRALDYNSKLTTWAPTHNTVNNTFANQALNTIFNPPCRAFLYTANPLLVNFKSYPILIRNIIKAQNVNELNYQNDLYITDPPYGDAVKYEEILEFFIAWLRKNPPPEFSNWVWDSRRALAIKGEDENFRRNMVKAYSRMTELMPDNGIQVIMFTHQKGTIWADMANIVWASGLQVTAAWYVVTETDSALRQGSHVKGTVLLVCRKRSERLKTYRDDLAYEIQEEVEEQVRELTGLNQEVLAEGRDENVFEDADLQMAGYAAALRVLTRYDMIDGKDMTKEALQPRVAGEKTFVDELIDFAVDVANRSLVPQGIEERYWKRLSGIERFYLKMLDMESRGINRLDNYQNFAKAFKVKNFKAVMASSRANRARLKGANELGRAEMGEGSEFYQSPLRAVLYALMELQKGVEGDEVLAHLTLNVPEYYSDASMRELILAISDYLSEKLVAIRPEEASAARVLGELVRNQRIG